MACLANTHSPNEQRGVCGPHTTWAFRIAHGVARRSTRGKPSRARGDPQNPNFTDLADVVAIKPALTKSGVKGRSCAQPGALASPHRALITQINPSGIAGCTSKALASLMVSQGRPAGNRTAASARTKERRSSLPTPLRGILANAAAKLTPHHLCCGPGTRTCWGAVDSDETFLKPCVESTVAASVATCARQGDAWTPCPLRLLPALFQWYHEVPASSMW
jgi:hypothetical protein